MPTQHICSPYDPEARWANKGSRTWVGYKVFFTETCDPDQPRLITHVATTPASTADETLVQSIHADLEEAGLLPTEHLMDAGFVRVEHVVESPKQYGVRIVGPTARDSSWQGHTPNAFDKSQLRIDWERRVVTCPMGKQSRYWLADQRGADRLVQVFFNRDDCLICPARAQCTRAKNRGRVLSLQPRLYHEALQDLRKAQRTRDFQQRYAARSGVECLFSQGSRRCDLQQARYRGRRKTQMQQLLSATAINLLRWDAWQQERPIAPTRHPASPLSWLPDFINSATGAALVFSGRGIRSLKRRHHIALGQLARKRQRCRPGSRRWRKLQRARRQVSTRKRRQIRTVRHQGTRKVITFCQQHSVGFLFIGNPDGVRRHTSGHHHNQRMSGWEYGQDITYLSSKSQAAGIESFTGSERGTSSQCPVCGWKQKVQGRQWRCRNPECAFAGHRDVVGSVNMHPLAFGTRVAFPARITYQRAGPVRVLARDKQPCRVQSSPPVVGARTRATRRA